MSAGVGPRFEVRMVDEVLAEDLARCTRAARTAIEPVVVTRMEKTIRGCYYGTARPRQDMPRIAEWYRRGLLEIDALVTRRYTLSDINRAYEDIDTDAVGRGVIVF